MTTFVRTALGRASLVRLSRPAGVRFSSSAAPKPTGMETSKPAHPEKLEEAPTTDANISYQTSRWAPTPTTPPPETEKMAFPVGNLSGAPQELQNRVVRIYQPAKPATQSGDCRGSKWRVDWDILPNGHRWENPLIGYQSTGDVVQGERMSFRTKEEAIRFVQRQGYSYTVHEPQERRFLPKSYATQFTYWAGKVKQVRTK